MYCTDKQFMKNSATAPSRIYIGGLPKTITADDLEAKFSKHGKVLGLVIKKKFAFIQYKHENEAHKAIRMENGTNMMGRKITVRQAFAKKDSGGGPQNQSKAGPMQKMEAPSGGPLPQRLAATDRPAENRNLEFVSPPAAEDCNMDVQDEEIDIAPNFRSPQNFDDDRGRRQGRGGGSDKTGPPTKRSAHPKHRSGAKKRRAKKRRLAAGSPPTPKLPATSSSEGSGEGTPVAAGGKRGGAGSLKKATDTSRQLPSGLAKAGSAKSKGVGTAGTGDSTRGVTSQTAEGPRIVVGLRGQETNLSSGDLLRFIGALNRWVCWCITREGAEEILPRVRAIRLWRGHILIVADNEETREWIRRELVNIRPWGLANLVEVDPEQMRLLRAAIWIPGLRADVSTETLVRCLGVQNGLDCRLWRVWQRTEEERGSRVVMEVDETSAKAIRSRGFLLFCLALQVRVSLTALGTDLGEGLTRPVEQMAEVTRLKAAEGSAAERLAASAGTAGSGGDPVAERSGPEEHRMSGQPMEVDAGTSEEATSPTGTGPAGGALRGTDPGDEDLLHESDSG